MRFKEFMDVVKNGGGMVLLKSLVGAVIYGIVCGIAYLILMIATGAFGEEPHLSLASIVMFGIFGIIILFMQSVLYAGMLGSYKNLVYKGSTGSFREEIKKYVVQVFGYTLVYSLGIGIVIGLLSRLVSTATIEAHPIFFLLVMLFLIFMLIMFFFPFMTFIVFDGSPMQRTMRFLDKNGNKYFLSFILFVVMSCIPVLNIVTSLGGYLYPLYIMILDKEEEKEKLTSEEITEE